MDVTCDRCKAEYEFDEALLGERGTTVKCSACGHVFRVLPPSRERARSALQLRYARDGSVRALSSLRELQQRIRAGEVSLDDQLGREGFPMRPLRDVPELKNFFLSQPGRQEQSTMRPEGTYPRPDPELPRMPVHPDSISPGAASPSFEGSALDGQAPRHPPPGPLESSPPPHQPGHLERAAAEARRREAAARTARAVAKQRAANRTMSGLAGMATDPRSTLAGPGGLAPEQRPRNFPRGTIAGVGRDEESILPPAYADDRAPEVGLAAPEVGLAAPEPAPPAPLHGDSSPRSSSPPPPSIDSPGTESSGTDSPGTDSSGVGSSEVGSSGIGLMDGSVTARPVRTLYGMPSVPTTNGMQPGSTHPLANRLSSDRPPEAAHSEPPPSPDASHSASLPSDPGATAREPEPSLQVPVLPVDEVQLPRAPADAERIPQRAPSQAGRKLYLDDDERAPPRANEGTRAYLYVGLLVLAIAGGGWFGMTRMRVSGKAALAPAPAADAELPIAADKAPDQAAPAEPGASDQPAAHAGPSGAPPSAPALPEPKPEVESAPPAKPRLDSAPSAAPVIAMAPPSAKPGARGRSEMATRGRAANGASPAGPAEPAAGENPAPPGQKNDKLARAERAAAASPQDYGAQLNLADALYAKGDNAAALDAYRKALSLRATGSEANSGMGFALLKAGKIGDSLPYFDRAASSGYAEANIGLGDAYRALGQPSSAKEAYQAYLDRLPTGARAEYARTWLGKLSGPSKAPERSAEPEPYRPAGELTDPSQ